MSASEMTPEELNNRRESLGLTQDELAEEWINRITYLPVQG
jgi:hypothetical protein